MLLPSFFVDVKKNVKDIKTCTQLADRVARFLFSAEASYYGPTPRRTPDSGTKPSIVIPVRNASVRKPVTGDQISGSPVFEDCWAAVLEKKFSGKPFPGWLPVLRFRYVAK
jgi:hypothetical protein